jgi:hypothetical protein
LAAAVLELLAEAVVDTAVIDIQIKPGETQFQSVIELTVYERGKSLGARGYGDEGEGQWRQLSGIRPDKAVIRWLMDTLVAYHPSQPVRVPVNHLNVKDQWYITVDRLSLSYVGRQRVTDEQVFDYILRKARKPTGSTGREWFSIRGDAAIGVWAIVVQIEEPGYVTSPEAVRKEREATLLQTKKKLTAAFNDLVTGIAERLSTQQKRVEFPIMSVAIGDYLGSKGFSPSFDIELADVAEAERAVAELRRLMAQRDFGDLERFLQAVERSQEE